MGTSNRRTGVAALALGLITMSSSFWADTTPVGAGFTLGFGAIAVIYSMWSLIARDPTKDHWALSVVGLILFVGPWVGQFAGDTAAWTSWIAGAAIMVLASFAYVHGESGNVPDMANGSGREGIEAPHPVGATR